MATEHAMATMEKSANDRIAAAVATLTARFGIEAPAATAERLDPRMAQIRVLERHAELLERIVAGSESASDPAPDAPESPQTGEPAQPDAKPAKPKKAR